MHKHICKDIHVYKNTRVFLSIDNNVTEKRDKETRTLVIMIHYIDRAYFGHDGFQLIILGEGCRRVVHHAAIIVTDAESVSNLRRGLIEIMRVT